MENEITGKMLTALNDRGLQLAVLRAVARALVVTHPQRDEVKRAFKAIADDQLTAILQELQVPDALFQSQRAAYEQQVQRWLLEFFQPQTVN